MRGARGSWYEQAQTATDIARLQTCKGCTAKWPCSSRLLQRFRACCVLNDFAREGASSMPTSSPSNPASGR
jgi:hypothetical protein